MIRVLIVDRASGLDKASRSTPQEQRNEQMKKRTNSFNLSIDRSVFKKSDSEKTLIKRLKSSHENPRGFVCKSLYSLRYFKK